ncbi:leucine--tRNA ligase [Candidatus Saccharibacteria bacterium]|nr:leucine--tRNA ligase [Candidatus Saccharibacteria bacterium]
MERYDPLKIEEKWQKIWEKEKPFKALEGKEGDGRQKMFIAEMFPYPSGAGLHVGHVRNFTIVDVLTRFYTQQKCNVLRPFGYDTFGLPAENYAIKTGVSPKEATKTNIDNFRKQAKRLGYAIDWDREINTSDPDYYHWTQWCFLQLFKKGLAYQKESYQWWCPVDKTVLANEQVENGCCWRCGHEVEKKKMKQWFFKITAYADELLDEIDALDWPEKIKTMQKNWIGRSEGAEIDFEVAEKDSKIKVFTTRPDTLFGASFLVLAPEHPLISKLINDNTKAKVEEYCASAIKKSEIERQENKEKTGVFTGSYAINPATGEEIPIWISDYVLMGYGEGAVMAVPAHDERDFEFAKKFDLKIAKVIEKSETIADDDLCYHGEGTLVNSGKFNGMDSAEAREEITNWLESQKIGKAKVTYKMRDWLISRQRYWGCPIPIAYDKNGKPHAIPEDQLPVVIPEVEDYKPDDSGRSALAKAKDWLKVEINGEEMTRETDTLDGYACSSWYLWRYASPHDKKHAWDQKAIKYWAPTDVYVGADHAVAHLLYIRFWCKFFADEGYLPFREPIKKLIYHGYINAPDGKKMSKSKGNVIDPLDVINDGYGADTLRTYEMFIGPIELDAAWDPRSVGGVYRFLNRCWTLCFDKNVACKTSFEEHPQSLRGRSEDPREDGRNERPEKDRSSSNIIIRNKTIKKVTEDIYNGNFNTAVAALMEYVNELYRVSAEKADLIALAKLLKPFAPHLASEMLESLKADDEWPVWNEKYLVADTVEFVVQVNGKLRAKLSIDAKDVKNEEKIKKLALTEENVKKYISGEPKKIIIPKNAKLINIVA